MRQKIFQVLTMETARPGANGRVDIEAMTGAL